MNSAADSRLELFDFEHPPDLVADRPSEPRDSARLLVLERATGAVGHAAFRGIGRWVGPGDCLVLNRTKVWPARLCGRKETGGKAELLLVRELEAGLWTVLSSDLKPGVTLRLEEVSMTAQSLNENGEWVCRFSNADVHGLMARQGSAPLPPYILKRRRDRGTDSQPADLADYQTVYAREEGSIAAPTAGLHFTQALLDSLRASGVATAEVTLHVGRGTFRPVTASDVRDHRMLPEWYSIGVEAAGLIEACRREGGRIVAVGTTAVRTLESWAASGEREGWTGLFIRPGHAFRLVDALVTNFHQPRSTPLLLSSAFAGRERLLAAYKDAVEEGYRLFSYGDAMLIL